MCALKASQKSGIHTFKASNGWVEKLLCRFPVQPSFRLRGKGDNVTPSGHAARMELICSSSTTYTRVEDVLPHGAKPYVSSWCRGSECCAWYRLEIALTECFIGDGNHSFPVYEIVNAQNITCWRDQRFIHHNKHYWSQSNDWIDIKGPEVWIKRWYEEVKKLSDGPWSLIMGNCGGHEVDVTLSGVHNEFKPPRTAAMHQPLELGLIEHEKILINLIYLRKKLHIMQHRRATNQVFRCYMGAGKWGVHEGQQPHLGDAMELFDASWRTLSRIALDQEKVCEDSHVQHLRSLLSTHDLYEDEPIDLTTRDSIGSRSG